MVISKFESLFVMALYAAKSFRTDFHSMMNECTNESAGMFFSHAATKLHRKLSL